LPPSAPSAGTLHSTTFERTSDARRDHRRHL